MDQFLCGGFVFLSDFDSGNLARVELVPREENTAAIASPSATGKNALPEEIPDFEFNIWTKPDCSGTEFENSNRTWFYFGIRGGAPFALIKFNIVNLNKQSKMYSQGMAPVYRVVPGRSHWDRVKDKPTYTVGETNFTLSFKHRTLENLRSTTYFAFTYPFSYTDLQTMLSSVDARFGKSAAVSHLDDIYYHRECICCSPEGLRVDLVTISSHHGKGLEREPRLQQLFPDDNVPRPFRFPGKKIVFVSARVHPGETPSSFVINGFMNLLLNRDDQIAITLRKNYVFKLIPMLNPDGVSKGHYRTDIRGCNLNRVYLTPSRIHHPSVFAARSLIRYYHHGCELDDDGELEPDFAVVNSETNEHEIDIVNDSCELSLAESPSHDTSSYSEDVQADVNKVSKIESQVSDLTLEEKVSKNAFSEITESLLDNVMKMKARETNEESREVIGNVGDELIDNRFVPENSSDSITSYAELESESPVAKTKKSKALPKVGRKPGRIVSAVGYGKAITEPEDSGLFLYVDMHGHASKKGIFMYGNHFENTEDSIECMLLPKIMSLNSQNFHFTACNFTERNMYLRDRRDGMSREGSGRVAVLKATGLVRSYTLECNYNTGRLVNTLPACVRDCGKTTPALLVPPKYNPAVFEDIGRALGVSILDLAGTNPWSRIPNSEFRTLSGIRDWLRQNCVPEQMHLRKVQGRRQPSTAQVGGTSSSCGSRSRLPGARMRRLVPLVIEPKLPGVTNLPGCSDRKENFSGFQPATGSMSPNSRKLKNCPEPKENVGPGISQRSASFKLKSILSPSSSVLKQIVSVRTKCAVVGALGNGSKSKAIAKGTQLQRIPVLNSGGGSKKPGQVIVTASSRLAKFRKTSSAAKLRDLNLGLCSSADATKTNRLPSEKKLVRLSGQRKIGGDQGVPKASKRMKIAPLKLEQASCSGLLTADTCPTEKDFLFESSLSSARKKGKSEDVELTARSLFMPECSLTSPWNQAANPQPDSTPRTLKVKNKFLQRKLVGIGPNKGSKPTLSIIKSVELEAQTASCSTKYSTKLDKPSKIRTLHLNPVKGLHKSPSFVKKKSSELVKKRGKVSLKTLATSVSKFRASNADQTQGAVTDKKKKKIKPKFL